MATRRRKRRTSRRNPVARRVASPIRRRRRSVRRRRHNPVVARRRNPRRIVAISNPRRRRHRRYSRRSNPGAMRIGEIFKDMVYGAGGAILTRVGTGAVRGLVPASFQAPYIEPVLQAAIAVFPVHMLGKKFLGQKQGDMMMLGGLISAGLALADAYFPNVQSTLANVIRFPVAVAPQTQIVTPVTGSGLGDVYDVDMVAAGFGDVEEVPAGMWS